MQRRNYIVLSILLWPLLVTAQSQKNFTIRPVTSPIVIDGKLDDPSWQLADSLDGFQRNFPDDFSPARFPTIVKVAFDTENLYISARLYRNETEKYSVSSLKEDFVFYENDAFGVIIDPFNDLTNGYGFCVNAYGARRDEQISSGTIADPTMDIKWEAEVERASAFYTVELSIPLKYIRHGSSTFWNVNFVRNDMGANERTAWVRAPVNFLLGNLAFTGKMQWSDSVLSSNKLYSIIPSLTLSETKRGNDPFAGKLKPSFDAKVALSTALNMDVTINPDFSQAEVDKVQVNLTRFEPAFPENRLFFVENSDLFSGFGDDSWGNPANRPFYSRKVGLRYDSTVSAYVPAPIIGGSRISGKINNNLRFGAMTLFTKQEQEGEWYTPSQNYTVFALQQKLFTRSNLAAQLVNRQAFGTDSSSRFAFNKHDFNRTLALEYNFASKDDKYSGKVYRHFMLDPRIGNSEYAQGFLLKHNTRQWRNWLQFTQISKKFQPDAGFVPRTNVLGVNIHGAYSIFPKKGKINQFEFVINPQLFLTATGQYADHFIISGFHAITKRTEDLWLVHIQERITLRSPFDPTFSDGLTLDSGAVTTYDYARFFYGSDNRQIFYWQTAIDAGQYYMGTQLRTEGQFSYRVQPWGSLGVNYNIGRFKLPAPYGENDVIYLGPRAELSFTRKLFLTSVVQYSSLAENINFYVRFQWRFRPLSDFFLVYSANQDPRTNAFKNHNLVMKAVLWL